MPRTKPKASTGKSSVNGVHSQAEVLTLADAAAYLRLSEQEVVRLIGEQGLPARQVGSDWRLLKSAVQRWLSTPTPTYSKEAQLAAAGTFRDDPDLIPLVEQIYRERGRPITEDGSYNLLHGLDREGGSK